MIPKAGSSFTVLGAGKSGTGISKLLSERGMNVTLYDDKSESELKHLNRNELESKGVNISIGNWSDEMLKCDVVIKSPGIPPFNHILRKLAETGVDVVTEIEAASWFCPCPVIAVTGTNGKTTTTVLTSEIFRNAGIDTKVCGNVGVAFSDVIDELRNDSIVILEVSSFQLNDIKYFMPSVGIITNITPDHLDWHGSFEEYLAAKMNIARNMDEECLLIVNYDDQILRKESARALVPKAYFGIGGNVYEHSRAGAFEENGKIYYFNKDNEIFEQIMETSELNIRGRHNLYNSLAAAISARSFGIKAELIADSLRSFAGVEHRIEFVREIDGVKYYNDSKATNTDSVIVALESFAGGITLIMGGREKGNDYSVLDKLVKEKVKRIIAIGEARQKIADHFRSIAEVIIDNSMEQAVATAKRISNTGDVVLLSPACKSFDMFESFEHRGEVFKQAVNKL